MSQPDFHVLDYEMVHYASDDLFIAHRADTITYMSGNDERQIKMPPQIKGWKNLCLPFRKLRRLLRLDKAMIIPTESGMVMARLGEIWVYDLDKVSWQKSEQKLNCRNPMYNGILRLDSGEIFLGEYGNPNGIGKRILKSTDNGSTWTMVHQFAPDEIRHIHCLAWDKYEEKIWIFTGDVATECKVLKADVNFESVEVVGSGGQEWRSCHAVFFESTVEWLMDSNIQSVQHVVYDRADKHIVLDGKFDGPVWFAYKYGDHYIATSVQEFGSSHTDNYVHVYSSTDFRHWVEITRFKKDMYPKKYFRYASLTTARSQNGVVYLSCEGINTFDGKTIVFG